MPPAPEDKRWAKFVTPGAADDCWEWQGYRAPDGYGRFNIAGRQTTSSRAAAIRAGMDVRDGLDVCHRCDNPPCVNPAHLYVGSRSRNIQDCADRGRHPKQGLRGRDWSIKYTDEQVAEWRRLYAHGWLFVDIARQCGAHPTTVSRVLRGLLRSNA